VVFLSDGHSSQFDYDVLSFLQSKNILLFLTPPNTTGVTQLLDQLNKNLHHKYRSTSPNDSLIIASPDKRKNSAAYWKAKFEALQQLIQDLSEKSIQLEEIPGRLLAIDKISQSYQKIYLCYPSP